MMTSKWNYATGGTGALRRNYW